MCSSWVRRQAAAQPGPNVTTLAVAQAGDIGKGVGCKVTALLTDMDQPLGRTVGNALEIVECIETLQGRGPRDLETLSVELAAHGILLVSETPVSA